MEKASLSDSLLESENTGLELPALDHGEVVLGTLVSLDDAGNPLVSLPHLARSTFRIALTTVPVQARHVGRQVALMFTQGINPQPIIMGIIHSPLYQVLDTVLANTTDGNELDQVVFPDPLILNVNTPQTSIDGAVTIDGKRLVLEGQEEIVLRCGDASITLDRTGKISIRGRYLLSRAAEVNRILGGSVQVN